jgi:hypothetical protein
VGAGICGCERLDKGQQARTRTLVCTGGMEPCHSVITGMRSCAGHRRSCRVVCCECALPISATRLCVACRDLELLRVRWHSFCDHTLNPPLAVPPVHAAPPASTSSTAAAPPAPTSSTAAAAAGSLREDLPAPHSSTAGEQLAAVRTRPKSRGLAAPDWPDPDPAQASTRRLSELSLDSVCGSLSSPRACTCRPFVIFHVACGTSNATLTAS